MSRIGRSGLDACLSDAVDIADRGYAVSPMTAAAWDGTAAHSAHWAKSSVPSGSDPAPDQANGFASPCSGP